MKKQLLTLVAASALAFTAQAQTDSTSTPLEISGSADAYWKYDFAKTGNIGTSFASDQNSLSLGMLDIALKKTTGKASFVGEISFGPRGQGQSIPDADPAGSSFNIQNLYATYAFTDKFSMTAGYMGTFVGYEVISPVGNFHYSTSYLFTNGPFQNAGIKANFAISDKVGIMAGLFQDTWNSYVANPSLGLNTFGAQLTLTPVEDWSAYLNFASGSASGTIYDLTTAYQITEKFKLGLNAADFTNGTDVGYSGIAIYPSVAVTDGFALGLRGESFKFKKNSGDETITALTFTANLKSGGLTFIPEFRLDNAKTNTFGFVDGNGVATKSASQFSLALVYAF
jgi:hypothetical protein